MWRPSIHVRLVITIHVHVYLVRGVDERAAHQANLEGQMHD